MEVAIVMGVIALTFAGFSLLITESSQALRSKAVATRLDEVTEAARGYVDTHFSELRSAAGTGAPVIIPVGRTSAGGAIPDGPGGLPSLQSGGFLGQAFVDVNAYGQHHVLLVREPQADLLEAMISTYGGTPIPDDELGRIAGLVGSRGGFMASDPVGNAAGLVTGTNGGWRTAAADWSAGPESPAPGGAMAILAFDDGQEVSDWLARFDVGVPEANRMHVTIDMNGNDLNNVDTIRSAAEILRIEDDLEVERDLSVGRNVSAVGTISADADVSSGNDVIAGRNLSVDNDAVIVGRNQSAVFVPTMAATEGVACSDRGAMATSGDGSPLFCVSGRWTRTGGLSGHIRVASDYVNGAGPWRNDTDGPLVVMLSGGYGYAAAGYTLNPCHLRAWANGQFVGQSMNANLTNTKQCSLTFMVESGGRWQVQSAPYMSGNGRYRMTVYE